jgi:hypothetical protein
MQRVSMITCAGAAIVRGVWSIELCSSHLLLCDVNAVMFVKKYEVIRTNMHSKSHGC